MSRYSTPGALDDQVINDGDRAFLKLNMRLEPHYLQPGEIAQSSNGRLDRGVWQPRRGIQALTTSLQTSSNILRVPFCVSGELVATSAEALDSTISVVNGHPFEGASQGWVLIDGLPQISGVDYNGYHFVSCFVSLGSPADNWMEFSPEGLDEPVVVDLGAGSTAAPTLRDSALNDVFGSCLYSDPNTANAESIMVAGNGAATLVSLADGAITTIDYPAGLELDGPVEMLQAFDKVYIFSDGSTPLEWDGGLAFAAVPSGDYVQPQVWSLTDTAFAVVSGLATATVVGNTTVVTGDMITLYSSTFEALMPFAGQQFKVVNATTTEIQFYIPTGDFSTVGVATVDLGREVSVGSGFVHCPAPAFASYHQRRLVCPYSYSPAGTGAWTFRGVRDEIVFSDILDPATYDAIENQFRITAGVADFLVALHPFYEDALVIFNRNSIHAVFGVSGALADTETRELTREIGCLARKSVAQRGSEILFLSDNGVYAVAFQDEYNLRGADTPLSEAIQPVIDRINPDLAADAVGSYFDNRYQIAVPLDSAPGAGDAVGNNAILVYNFLNQGWESIDTVGSDAWAVMNFHIARAGERNDLYAVTQKGGVHLMNSIDERRDRVALGLNTDDATDLPVESLLIPRQYDFDMQDRKRFFRVQIIVEGGSQAADAQITFVSEDPDGTSALGTISSQLGGQIQRDESISYRQRVGGLRGHGGSVTIYPTEGRPRFKTVMVEGTINNRSTTTQS